jgi:hypothetical protein
MTIPQAELLGDWEILDAERARGFEAELARELSPVHRLNGVPMQAVAVRTSSDDALFRHRREPNLWSVVHLTWSGKQEPSGWPAVEFTGTFVEFHDAYTSPP